MTAFLRKSTIWLAPAGGIVMLLCTFAFLSDLGGLVSRTSSTSSLRCQDESVSKASVGKVLWQHRVDSGTAYRPLYANGVVVAVDRSVDSPSESGVAPFSQPGEDKILALEALTGDEKWKVSGPDLLPSGSRVTAQAISDSYFAFATGSSDLSLNRIVVAKLDTGKTVLDLPATAIEIGLGGHTLFVRDLSRNLQAYDLLSGQSIWTVISGERAARGLWYRDGLLYEVLGASINIRGVEDGRILKTIQFEFPEAPENVASTVLLQGSLLIAETQTMNAYYLIIYNLDKSMLIADPKPVSFSEDLLPPAVIGNSVFMFGSRQALDLFAIANDQMSLASWNTVSLSGNINAVSAPVALGSNVYFLASDGGLDQFDPTTNSYLTVVKSFSVRYHGNIPGNSYNYVPGISQFPQGLLIAFGCRSVVAWSPDQP